MHKPRLVFNPEQAVRNNEDKISHCLELFGCPICRNSMEPNILDLSYSAELLLAGGSDLNHRFKVRD